MNSLKQVVARVKADYLGHKNKKFMMVDALIAYTLATAAVQVTPPFASHLSMS